MCYPWHPWYGKVVYVHGKTSKHGHTFFRCGLEAEAPRMALEIPGWMFDRAACCLMQLKQVPSVDAQVLRTLKQLLLDVTTAEQADVIQAQHGSSHKKGHADAKVTTTSRKTTALVSGGGEKAELAKPARRDQARRHASAGAIAKATSQHASAASRRERGVR